VRFRSRAAALAFAFAFGGSALTRPALADGELDTNRERFRAGLEKYNQGQFADAIVVWEDILKDIGHHTGYRLAFNLGRAYEAFGSPTRAAERYELFLAEVDERAKGDSPLEAQVVSQATQARGRLEDLSRTLARIRTLATVPPTVVQIDVDAPRVSGFLAYVQPGRHRILQKRGAIEAQREIDCVAGKTFDLEPLADPPPRTPPPPEPKPPVSGTWVAIAAGATAVSFALPAVLYTRALNVRADALSADRDAKPALYGEYEDARTLAYRSWIVPAVLTAATGGLAAFYLFGRREAGPVTVQTSGAGAAVVVRY